MKNLPHVALYLLSLQANLLGYFQSLFFRCAQRYSQKVQHRTLVRIIKTNQDSEFGRKYTFESISSVDEFRSRVPIHTYEALRPFVEGGTPKRYLQTSGTTGTPKFVPVSERTLAACRRFQNINTFFQRKASPGLFDGGVLEIVSSANEGFMHDGTPFGSMSGLFSESLPQFVRLRRILPREVFSIPDYEHRYLLIAAIALREDNITCMASANPSTLLKLIDVINKNRTVLGQYLSTGDLTVLGIPIPASVEKVVSGVRSASTRCATWQTLAMLPNDIKLSDLWPRLRAVVTWTGGNCALFIPKLRQHLSPQVTILEVGYLASEFWGTIMLEPSQGCGLPTIQDTFFEFIEPPSWESGERDTLVLHELEDGKRYYIIATTADGLYRYFINDVIEVKRIGNGAPLIAFVQKGKGVTSLTGEKLYEAQVVAAVHNLSRQLNVYPDSFVLLADERMMAYVLYIESVSPIDTNEYACALDTELSRINVEYASKLQSGRLGPLQVRRVRQGTFDESKRSKIKEGMREGQFKSLTLQYAHDVSFPFHEFELL